MIMPRAAFLVRIISLGFFVIFDAYALRRYYQENDKLPFRVPSQLQEEIAKYLPPVETPVPTPRPIEQDLEFSDGQWIGSIVYGKLTNHSQSAIISPTLRFSLSKTQDDLDVIRTYTATVAARLAPNESVYFSQRFTSVPSEVFWWNGTVTHATLYTDQKLSKPPTGQTISSKPIIPPTGGPLTQAVEKDTTPWGVAKQIDDVTWTIKVGQDDRMATPQETFAALNAYRLTHGSGTLSWDDNLATFASSRAKYLNSIRSTDSHKGFKDYLANEENYTVLGFRSLGENIGYGSKLIGVHLIEWIYAADEGHNRNQLDARWSHVGIGIDGLGVAFTFAGDKL